MKQEVLYDYVLQVIVGAFESFGYIIIRIYKKREKKDVMYRKIL